MAKVNQGGFRDPSTLTTWTRLSLYAQVVVSIVAVMSGALEYQLLSDFKAGVYQSQTLAIEAGEASDARQRIVGFVQLVIFIVSGFMILKWIHRASFNARQLGAEGLAFTPRWAIGWYFVPIANLWKPYQAMKEIWKASKNPEHWSAQPVSGLLPWWWFVWIVSNGLANAAFRVAMGAEDLDELLTSNVLVQISDISGIPLSIIFVVMVNRIHAMQMAHAERGT